jgi:GNAT superfamily N-acetyltransferase
MDLRRHTERRVYLLETEDYGWEIIDPIHPDLIPEPQVEDVLKHGTHDQKTHGNWATGVSLDPSVASSILERVRENGGLSVNMIDGSEPKTGYMVAKDSKLGQIASAEDFYDSEKGPKILADYMKKNRADLATGKNYLGLWHNTADGQVYLDISENISDRETARTLGAKRDQISIWDVANFAEIDTGGTGNVGKNRSYQTSRYITDERRANRQLRSGVVGKDSKAYEVIYFEAGLKPILKHQEHDQSSHGNWSRGISAEDEALIDRMSSLGPSLDDLETVLSGGATPDYSDLVDLVNNDFGLYSDAIEDIDYRVEEALERLQAEFPLHEYTEQEKATIYENIQRDLIERYVDDNEENITSLWRETNNVGIGNAEELTSFFDDVYRVDVEIRDNNGKVINTIGSTVESVFSDENVQINGSIYNSDGDTVGEFQRSFYKERNDNGKEVWVVEHDIFRLDSEYRGSGFGTKFLEQQEAWYVSKGIAAINLGTAWDGARHWARAGFDFNPQYITSSINDIALRANALPELQSGSPARAEFDSIMKRAVEGYGSPDNTFYTDVKSMKGGDFPIPNDFAMVGYKSRVQTGTNSATGKPEYTWAGKKLLDNLNLKYRKVLTPEGRTLSQGPIDRDGDGLVFDGTIRERPASTVNS